MRSLFSGKRPERLTREAVHGPLVVRRRAQPLVEADRVLVPVEHRPLEPAAVALDGDLCQLLQEVAADADATVFRLDEQVLEVDAGLGEERREVVKEQREPDRLAVELCDQGLGVGPLAEERVAQLLLVGDHHVLELLVLRERLDEVDDQRHVRAFGEADLDGHFFGLSRRRKTKRMAPCESEKLAILLSTRPASSPAWIKSVSFSGLSGPFGRMTQMAPLGSIHVFSS